MSGALYVLDTSVFIQAHRQHYPFDVVPAFWDALIDCARSNYLASLDVVDRELSGNDDLSQWARAHKRDLFRSTDTPDVTEAYRRVIAWVEHNSQYVEAAKSAFASGADGWITAFAMAHGHTVVTQEVASPASRTNVKIPDVCAAMNVTCVNSVQMMRRVGMRLNGFTISAASEGPPIP